MATRNILGSGPERLELFLFSLALAPYGESWSLASWGWRHWMKTDDGTTAADTGTAHTSTQQGGEEQGDGGEEQVYFTLAPAALEGTHRAYGPGAVIRDEFP